MVYNYQLNLTYIPNYINMSCHLFNMYHVHYNWMDKIMANMFQFYNIWHNFLLPNLHVHTFTFLKVIIRHLLLYKLYYNSLLYLNIIHNYQ